MTGIGQGRVTDNLAQDIDLIDDALYVRDELSIEMVYRLLDEEGFVPSVVKSDVQVVHGSIDGSECGRCGNDGARIGRRQNNCDDSLRYFPTGVD